MSEAHNNRFSDSQPARVLIVDDNETCRYTLAHYLRAAGHQTLEARGGEEALRKVAEAKPDLLLLDVHMPDINGYEVCRRLRADPETARLGIIQISSLFTGPGDRAEGLKSGADAYLATPLEPGELFAQVATVLNRRARNGSLPPPDLNPPR